MKLLKLAALVMVVFLLSASPVSAQKPGEAAGTAGNGLAVIGAGLGMAFALIGAGYGLGRIGSAALESMARQPQAAPSIQTAMIIIAAMLEGATLAAVILCYLIGNKAEF
jgi:F-type H+-transporting ATPase subunit c